MLPGVSSARFFDAGVLVDRELQLVEPAAVWVEPMVASAHHAGADSDDPTPITRTRLLEFVQRSPRGREGGDPFIGRAPAYYFWMRLMPQGDSPIPFAGTVSLRIGSDLNLTHYIGHVGYGVFPAARGHHYAERSVRLLLPLARRHGMSELWITCNPDNVPSRRTCERLGCELVEIVPLPLTHPLYQRGERLKCRYRLDLSGVPAAAIQE